MKRLLKRLTRRIYARSNAGVKHGVTRLTRRIYARSNAAAKFGVHPLG
jgi:hypothetical protein